MNRFSEAQACNLGVRGWSVREEATYYGSGKISLLSISWHYPGVCCLRVQVLNLDQYSDLDVRISAFREISRNRGTVCSCLLRVQTAFSDRSRNDTARALPTPGSCTDSVSQLFPEDARVVDEVCSMCMYCSLRCSTLLAPCSSCTPYCVLPECRRTLILHI